MTLVLALCISVAISASVYLLWTNLTSSPIAGCGIGGGWVDCENVASSPWALWLGVPVSFLALGIYLAMATALVTGSVSWFSRSVRKVSWVVVTTAVFAAGLSAMWFVALQLIVLKHICLYCMIAHTCGLVATVTMLLASPLRAKAMLAAAALSFVGLAVLVVGQVFARPQDMHRIEKFDNPAGSESEQIEFAPPTEGSPAEEALDEKSNDELFQPPTTDNHSATALWPDLVSVYFPSQARVTFPTFLATEMIVDDASVPESANRRIVAIQGGAIKLDVAQWPLVGSNDAKYVFVAMFDYCCPPCRKTYMTVSRARENLDDQLAVICLPVPLNSTCNPSVRVTNPNFEESCELAKLAVAVWRVDPTRFASLHNWMFQGSVVPSYADAKMKAATLVDDKKLDAEIASGIPDRYIAKHVEIYQKVGAGAIPKLMFPRTSIIGEYSSVEGMVDVIRHEAK